MDTTLVMRIALLRKARSARIGTLRQRRSLQREAKYLLDTDAASEAAYKLLEEEDAIQQSQIEEAIGDGQIATAFLDAVERILQIFEDNEELFGRLLKLFGLLI